LNDLGQVSSPISASSPNSASVDLHKVAAILVQHSEEIRAIDHYERRALSRRRFAIRALDGERQNKEIIPIYNHFWQNEAN
jgi:hypothetical protein